VNNQGYPPVPAGTGQPAQPAQLQVQAVQAAQQAQAWQPAQPAQLQVQAAQPAQLQAQVAQQQAAQLQAPQQQPQAWQAAPAAASYPSWQQPAGIKKKKSAGTALTIALCTVIAVLVNLGGILIYDHILGGRRTVYTDPIVVSTLDANPWSKVADDIYDCSVAFMVTASTGSWAGSGVVISPDGYVLTNDHVAGDSAIRKMECTLRNGMSYTGALVAKDAANDLALVKLDTTKTDMDYVRIGNSDLLQVGDRVVTLGNPLGVYPDTLAEGIIANVDRELEIGSRPAKQKLIQVTAPVCSGNSGGALLNYRGELVAIVNARATSQYYNGSITDAENIGFCVPVNFAVALIKSSGANINVPDTPTLDILVSAVSREEAKKSAVCPVEGVYIDKVAEFGAGWYAGLQKYDRLVSINRKDVTGPDDVAKLIKSAGIGGEVTVVVERNAMYYQYTVVTMREYS